MRGILDFEGRDKPALMLVIMIVSGVISVLGGNLLVLILISTEYKRCCKQLLTCIDYADAGQEDEILQADS